MKFSLEAPWYTLQKKVKALFERDKDITVGEIYQPESGDANYAFDIEVRNHNKFMALDRVMVKKHVFGNVKLAITLFDEENAANGDNRLELYRTIFEGNPIVKDIRELVDFSGTTWGYVRFQPEVIQFLADNTADYDRNWTGLAQDIASEVFASDLVGINFCTANIKESD